MNKAISKDPKAYLISYAVESFSKPVLIESEHTYIGGDPNGSIQIANETASPQHALIISKGGDFFIEDLGSQNGTFLNNNRIQKAQLSSHDKIYVGNRTFLFLIQPETISGILMDPSISSSEAITISSEEIDLSDFWAQNTNCAVQGFFQQVVSKRPQNELEPEQLAQMRLSMLYRLSESLQTINDIEQMYAKGLDLVIEAIPATDCALIAIKSVTDDSFKIVSLKLRNNRQAEGDAIPISRTLFDWVLSEKVTLLSQNVSSDLRFQDSDSIRIHNLRSIICVPITGKNTVIGLLYAQSNSSLLNPFSKEDAAFASAVTNELALNIENIRLQTKALRNERMAAIGLTVSNLAHNIKNLVAINQGAAQLMDFHLARMEHPQIEKCWQWIQQSLTGINRLSNDILEYVKEDQLLKSSYDVNNLILSYKKYIEKSFTRDGIKFEYVLSKRNPIWMLDEVQFQRALFNLVLNAADALNERKQGRIRISTSVIKNRFLLVSVTDNGCGISPKIQDKVLDLFFTTKGTEGTGLGLPMVQKYVERSGGKLRLKSKEGIGSIFQMIFPNI